MAETVVGHYQNLQHSLVDNIYFAFMYYVLFDKSKK